MESEEPIQDRSQVLNELALGQDRTEAAASARSLVDRMVEAGEWPEPALIEQIVAAGDAAVPALLDVLRTRPSGWPEEAPLSHALGVVSMLRPPEALPLLVELGRYYKEETGEEVGDTLAAFGAVGVEKLLELIRQPSVRGFHRLYFISSAVTAAGDDPVLKANVAETIREIVDHAMIRARLSRQDLVDDVPDPLLNDPNEAHASIEIGFLISNLADLADPLAVEMIEAAFEEDQVALEVINRRNVKAKYDAGGRAIESPPNWLNDYRKSYAYKDKPEFEAEPEPSAPDRFAFPSRSSYPSFERESTQAPPPQVQPVVTIRHAAPKIGRNDPCWCGSGKKYKKCHLGKDAPR